MEKIVQAHADWRGQITNANWIQANTLTVVCIRIIHFNMIPMVMSAQTTVVCMGIHITGAQA